LIGESGKKDLALEWAISFKIKPICHPMKQKIMQIIAC